MFEKIIKFGCGFIVISIVAWICFVVISSAYLSAGLASDLQEDRAPEITMMSSPKTLHISKFKVDEVLEDGSAVAHVEDFSADIDFLFSAKFCLKKVICLKMKYIQFPKRAFWDTPFRCEG